jgi:hypothetical protein
VESKAAKKTIIRQYQSNRGVIKVTMWRVLYLSGGVGCLVVTVSVFPNLCVFVEKSRNFKVLVTL